MSLLHHWQQLDRKLGGNPSQTATYEALITAYQEPHRAYHTLAHLQHCLQKLDQVAELAQKPDVMALALWFHDAVYDPRRADNEALGADWAARYLQAGKAAVEMIAQVCTLILATRHDTLNEESTVEGDMALLMDIDLTILATPPAEFDVYDAAIRQEYAWVAEPLYRKRRAEVLTGFLQHQPSIKPAFSIIDTNKWRASI